MQKVVVTHWRLGSSVLASRSFATIKRPNYLHPDHSKLMVVGAGFSGLTAIAHVPRITTIRKVEMRAFDGQSFVSYNPQIDLVPFGIKTQDEIQRPILQILNDTTGIEFVSVEKINPQKNSLTTVENQEYNFDYLVLAAGLEPNYSKVKGLQEALEDRDAPVVTGATMADTKKSQKEFELFYNGKVIFYNNKKAKTYYSAINTALLFDEQLRQRKGGGIRSMSEISYITNDNTVFPDVKASVKVKDVFLEKQINFDSPPLELIEVDKDARKAIFLNPKTQETVEKEFDLLFVNPEFSLPEFLKDFSNSDGYLNIDESTLIHNQYPNIFALGHCARNKNSIVTTKSIVEQSLAMNANIELTLEAATEGKAPTRLVKYSGVTEVPFYVGNRKCLVAEIDPTRPDSAKTASTKDFFKQVYIEPKIYFSLLTQGVWFGESGFRMPKLRAE
jgi:thioredoxin reductase